MTERLKGVATRIRNVALCVAQRSISCHMKNVLQDAVKVVNLIKARPLNSRLFTELCHEVGSDHHTHLLHTEVRWLSRGKVLTRLFELRSEVLLLLNDVTSDKSSLFLDEDWLSRLAYLADIFTRLNSPNLSLQGRNKTVFNAIGLSLKSPSTIYLHFRQSQSFGKIMKSHPKATVIKDILEHLQKLKVNILQ